MKAQTKHKKALVALLCLISSRVVLAQQQLATNQNYWFLAQENIAAVAENSKLNAQGLYRRNWLRVDQSPELIFFRLETSTLSHGWDIKVQQYSNSFFRRQEFKLGWRYSLKLDEKQKLNFGLRLGLLRSSYSWANLNAQNPEELPELFMKNNWVSPVADFGFAYTYSAFCFSFHGANLNLRASASANSGIAELPSFSILTYYRFKIQNHVLAPVVQVRSILGLPLTYDYSILVEKEKKYGLQCGFKNRSSVYTNVRLNVSPQIALSYSYDYPITLHKFSGPGNELAIVFFTK